MVGTPDPKDKSFGSGKDSSIIDLDDPLSLHTSDISSVTIVNIKLTGTLNYQAWATATSRALTIRNKLGFIDGTCVRPDNDESRSVKWDRADAVVVSWLLSSMSDNISSAYILSDNAKNLWSELKQTYEKVNLSVIYSAYQRINLHTQGTDSVSDYFNTLNGFWKEFDSLSKLTVCTCAAAQSHQNFSNQLKLLQFLMGLNDNYNQIRSNILMLETVPTVQTAFSTISREESLKGSTSHSSSKTQTSVFNVKAPDLKKKSNNNTLQE